MLAELASWPHWKYLFIILMLLLNKLGSGYYIYILTLVWQKEKNAERWSVLLEKEKENFPFVVKGNLATYHFYHLPAVSSVHFHKCVFQNRCPILSFWNYWYHALFILWKINDQLVKYFLLVEELSKASK